MRNKMNIKNKMRKYVPQNSQINLSAQEYNKKGSAPLARGDESFQARYLFFLPVCSIRKRG